mgnify:FL=1
MALGIVVREPVREARAYSQQHLSGAFGQTRFGRRKKTVPVVPVDQIVSADQVVAYASKGMGASMASKTAATRGGLLGTAAGVQSWQRAFNMYLDAKRAAETGTPVANAVELLRHADGMADQARQETAADLAALKAQADAAASSAATPEAKAEAEQQAAAAGQAQTSTEAIADKTPARVAAARLPWGWIALGAAALLGGGAWFVTRRRGAT